MGKLFREVAVQKGWGVKRNEEVGDREAHEVVVASDEGHDGKAVAYGVLAMRAVREEGKVHEGNVEGREGKVEDREAQAWVPTGHKNANASLGTPTLARLGKHRANFHPLNGLR